MEALQFVYWLQGALELTQLKELNEAQVKIVQDHLNLVLKKVTPQYNFPQVPSLQTPGQLGRSINVPFDQIAVTC